MKTREKAKNAGVLAGGIFVVLSAISPVMAHPGGAAPPSIPPFIRPAFMAIREGVPIWVWPT